MEDTNQILGVQETPQAVNKEGTPSYPAESILKWVAIVVLVVGVIAAIILLVTMGWVQDPKYTYHKEMVFNPMGFVMSIITLLSSITTWAVLNVLSNISINLFEIKSNSNS